MTNLGYLSLCNFGNFLAPVLVTVHTVNGLNLGHRNEGYEYY